MKSRNVRPITILMAEDDPDDRELAREAFVESRLINDLRFVESGDELLDYLKRRGAYSAPGAAPTPGLVLLDLNMPGMDGREALERIKSDPALKHIPVVVMTTSRAEEDVLRSYQHGANSYITKPVSFEGLGVVVRMLERYWLQIVDLPPGSGGT